MIEWYQLLFSHNQCPVFCLVTNAPGSYDPPSTKKHCGTAVFSYFFGTRKAEVLNSLIINTTAKANDTTDILQTFR